MKRGPVGKSGEEQELDGNPGKRRVRGPPPSLGAAPALLPPPSHLSKLAKAFWKLNYEPLRRAGMIEATDLLAFELLCASYSRWRDAEDQLAEDGARVKTSNGSSGPSPFFRIARQAADEVQARCEQFGLTPPSRARLEITPPPRKPTDDEEWEAQQPKGDFAGLVGRRPGGRPQ